MKTRQTIYNVACVGKIVLSKYVLLKVHLKKQKETTCNSILLLTRESGSTAGAGTRRAACT